MVCVGAEQCAAGNPAATVLFDLPASAIDNAFRKGVG